MDIPQDQDNSSLIIQKLENELKKYKSQTKKFKKQVSTLKHQINSKDQLLDEKSKLIISCFSENLQLKQQIKILKRQLHISHSNIRKPSKPSKCIDELTPQSSFDSNTDENVSISNQMPYFITPTSNSVSSNLSEQACKISFPSPYKMPTNNINSQLSPIEENDDQYKNAFTPITIMSDLNSAFKMIQSDNNSLIQQNEWHVSIATISTTPSPKSLALVNEKSIPLVNTKSRSIPLIDAKSIHSDDEENEFGTITSMTQLSFIGNNNSENGVYNDNSMIYKSGKENTILNILTEVTK